MQLSNVHIAKGNKLVRFCDSRTGGFIPLEVLPRHSWVDFVTLKMLLGNLFLWICSFVSLFLSHSLVNGPCLPGRPCTVGGICNIVGGVKYQ